MATSPINISFVTTSTDYDLFADATIQDQISKHFSVDTNNTIAQGNAAMKLTVFVDSVTQIKFDIADNYQNFIMDLVYSSNGEIFPRHCFIKDNIITGMVSMQII